MTEDSTLVHRVAVAPIFQLACQRLLSRSRPAEEARLHNELGSPQSAFRSVSTPNLPTPTRKYEGKS